MQGLGARALLQQDGESLQEARSVLLPEEEEGDGGGELVLTEGWN